jgi:hypothetical protein
VYELLNVNFGFNYYVIKKSSASWIEVAGETKPTSSTVLIN